MKFFNKMDAETAHYLLENYSHTLSVQERSAIYYLKLAFVSGDFSPNSIQEKIIRELKWLNSDNGYISVVARGNTNFEKLVAERINEVAGDSLLFNHCPNCNKLARTIKAKQCRYCNFSWHDK